MIKKLKLPSGHTHTAKEQPRSGNDTADGGEFFGDCMSGNAAAE